MTCAWHELQASVRQSAGDPAAGIDGNQGVLRVGEQDHRRYPVRRQARRRPCHPAAVGVPHQHRSLDAARVQAACCLGCLGSAWPLWFGQAESDSGQPISLPGGSGKVSSDYAGGVPVETPASAVVAHGGPWIGHAGGIPAFRRGSRPSCPIRCWTGRASQRGLRWVPRRRWPVTESPAYEGASWAAKPIRAGTLGGSMPEGLREPRRAAASSTSCRRLPSARAPSRRRRTS